MKIFVWLFQIIGAIGFLLYGINTVSDGLQKIFSSRMERLIHFMKKNRYAGILTGILVTLIIQSSGAATVTAVTFVNAGIINLTQAAGLIFGANVGTTITTWIIAIYECIGSDILIIPISIFGLGWILTMIKKNDIFKSAGYAIMGLGFVFLGVLLFKTNLSLDKAGIISSTSQLPELLAQSSLVNAGALSIMLGLFAGIALTILLHLSSAVIAMLMVINHNGIIPFEFCAAVIVGANIGSTINAIIASTGAKVNARRAALIHVMFNVAGGILILCLYKPLMMVMDLIIPQGELNSPVNASLRIAMFHTMFNLLTAVIFSPLTNKIALLSTKIIRPNSGEVPAVYKIENPITAFKENTPAIILQVQNETEKMADFVFKMMKTLSSQFTLRNWNFFKGELTELKTQEDYLDTMKEELTKYLTQTFENTMTENQTAQVNNLLHTIDELESTSDYILGAAMILKKCVKKEIEFEPEDLERIDPYLWVVQSAIEYSYRHLNKKLTADEAAEVEQMQSQNVLFQKNLIKTARDRLENGTNVKAELFYIDLIRTMNKIGDHAYNSFNIQ
ncbi:MAG: Na/Pi cotransporter family protein [Treponema sp.]|nr:Na/Pi cotransporter family protein [Treponema sp.]